MRRRLIALLAFLAIASLGVVPSHAGTKKPNWKGGYSLTLNPDPSEDARSADGCNGVLPGGTDKRKFTVPAAGKLTITLNSPDPTNKGVTDWDFWLMNPDGTAIDGGHGGTSSEQKTTKFKKKTTFELQVCNLAGTTKATVDYLFVYA